MRCAAVFFVANESGDRDPSIAIPIGQPTFIAIEVPPSDTERAWSCDHRFLALRVDNHREFCRGSSDHACVGELSQQHIADPSVWSPLNDRLREIYELVSLATPANPSGNLPNDVLTADQALRVVP